MPQSKYLTKSYLEALEREPEVNGAEIVTDIMARAGLSFGG